eukprot:4798132-Amphidinium_carterae.1
MHTQTWKATNTKINQSAEPLIESRERLGRYFSVVPRRLSQRLQPCTRSMQVAPKPGNDCGESLNKHPRFARWTVMNEEEEEVPEKWLSCVT